MIGGLLEQVVEATRRDERVERRQPGIDDGETLESSVSQAAGEDCEDERLGRPRDRQRGVGEEVRRSDRGKSERRRADDQPEIGQSLHLERRECRNPDGGCDEERRPPLDAIVEQLDAEHERAAERREPEGERERVELGPLDGQLATDRDPEQNEGEGRCDDDGARARRRVDNKPLDLNPHEERGRNEQLAPVARHCDSARGDENDDRERGGLPRHAGVEGLQRRRERGTEEADPRDDLRAPAKRYHGRDRSNGAGQRQRQPVGDEVVAGSRRGERCIAARDACADCGKRRPVLAVARPEEETGAEDERRGRRAERDASAVVDPATIRGEDEEQPDAQRHHGATGDRKATRAHEIPVPSQLARTPPGRRRRDHRPRR